MSPRTSLPIGPARQGGAALVIGLVLLLVLTLLAVAGMNSASTELLMAGNEQYRQNAFRAAETGIESAMQAGAFTGAAAPDVTGGAGDTLFTVSIVPQLNGNVLSSEAGHDFEVAGSIHYVLQSVGTSTRGATSTNWQGIAQLVPRTAGDVTADAGTGTTAF